MNLLTCLPSKILLHRPINVLAAVASVYKATGDDAMLTAFSGRSPWNVETSRNGGNVPAINKLDERLAFDEN